MGYTNVPANSVEQLKAAIDKQPVAVTIEADKTVFQQYTSGILDSKLRNQPRSRRRRCWIRYRKRTRVLHRQKLMGCLMGRPRIHQDRRCRGQGYLRYPNAISLPRSCQLKSRNSSYWLEMKSNYFT